MIRNTLIPGSRQDVPLAKTPLAAHSDMRDLRFQGDVTRLCDLEPRTLQRVLTEMLREIGARNFLMTEIENTVARYARIDRDALGAVGGDRFAPRPGLRLVGGRRHG